MVLINFDKFIRWHLLFLFIILKIIFYYLVIYVMYECLCICLHTIHVAGVNRGLKKISDSLELELQEAVIHHVGAGK